MRKFTAQNKRETDSSLNSLGKGYAFYMFKLLNVLGIWKYLNFIKIYLTRLTLKIKQLFCLFLKCMYLLDGH